MSRDKEHPDAGVKSGRGLLDAGEPVIQLAGVRSELGCQKSRSTSHSDGDTASTSVSALEEFFCHSKVYTRKA